MHVFYDCCMAVMHVLYRQEKVAKEKGDYVHTAGWHVPVPPSPGAELIKDKKGRRKAERHTNN